MPKFLEVTDTAAARAALETPAVYNIVSVKDHGAVGDGVTDDTDAIEAAFAAGSGGIYFPKGAYVYNGTGMSDAYPTIVGAGWNETRIILGATSYLLNISIQMGSLNVRGFKTEGGKGVIKYTYSGSNVVRKYAVMDCEFNDYTECAIASDGADMPYWLIRNCYFEAANALTTMGVALGGGTDQCVIDTCSFTKNRIHLKAKSGNNLQITNCDFLQVVTENSSGPRVAVWIVPGATTNSGQGLFLRGSKFGNEGLVAGDYKILYADEGSGATNGVKFPNLSADSTGYIIGHSISNCMFMTNASAAYPVIYSTTPNVRGLSMTDCYDEGSSYLLEFRTAPSVPNGFSTLNVFGPINGPGIHSGAGITRMSNAIGVGYINDPAGAFQDTSVVRGSGSSAGYEELLGAEADEFGADNATVVAATDVTGGGNAATYTYTTAAGATRRALSAFTPDVPVFIEFDLKNPDDGNALEILSVYIQDNASYYHWSRRVEVPTVAQGWVTYRFHFTPRTAGATHRLYFANYGGGSNKTVIVGRPRVYHGNSSQLGGLQPAAAAAATTVMGAADLSNDIRNKLITLGVVSGTPSSGSVTTLGQVSTIELGHATDTTISRTSAGQLAVEGNPLGTKVAVPASAGATGVVGQWAAESGWLYICVAANTWERVAIASW